MSDVELQAQRAERGRKILAEISQRNAEEDAHYRAFAETVQSPNKKFVHRRKPAAAMVSTAIGTEFSEEALRKSDCPFIVLHKVALYSDDDLRALAERILDSAPLRCGAPDKRRRRNAA